MKNRKAISCSIGAFMLAISGNAMAQSGDRTAALPEQNTPISGFKGTGAVLVANGEIGEPIGHYDFCREKSRQVCQHFASANEIVHLTPDRWADIVRINTQVNLAVTPMNDWDMFGKDVEENWNYPIENQKTVGYLAGDCEDFVLRKQQLLLAAGIPDSAIRITVVRQIKRDMAGHAVLTLKTDRGDLILDSLDPRILPVSAVTETYKFRSMQSGESPREWETPGIVKMTPRLANAG